MVWCGLDSGTDSGIYLPWVLICMYRSRQFEVLTCVFYMPFDFLFPIIILLRQPLSCLLPNFLSLTDMFFIFGSRSFCSFVHSMCFSAFINQRSIRIHGLDFEFYSIIPLIGVFTHMDTEMG